MFTLAESIYASNVNLKRLEKAHKNLIRNKNEWKAKRSQKVVLTSSTSSHLVLRCFSRFLLGNSHLLPSITVDLLSWFYYLDWFLFIHTVAQGIDDPGHGTKYKPSLVVYLRSITDIVDASIKTLFWLTGIQTILVFSYSAAQSCPTLTKLWFSLFLSTSQRFAVDDNLVVALPVQRVYGLSLWSSYCLCSCPIGRCVSHHQW